MDLNRKGRYKETILFADSGLRIAVTQNLKDTVWADYCTWFYTLKGDSYFNLGNDVPAMDNYFNARQLAEMKSLLELSVDFINGYHYDGSDTHYLRTGVYQRMMEKADTDEKKRRLKELYPHLAGSH